MSPADQRAHIADGDYVWCEDCAGAGYIEEPRGSHCAYRCGLCDGDGILYVGEDMAA